MANDLTAPVRRQGIADLLENLSAPRYVDKYAERIVKIEKRIDKLEEAMRENNILLEKQVVAVPQQIENAASQQTENAFDSLSGVL